jgi:hypothetical protein
MGRGDSSRALLDFDQGVARHGFDDVVTEAHDLAVAKMHRILSDAGSTLERLRPTSATSNFKDLFDEVCENEMIREALVSTPLEDDAFRFLLEVGRSHLFLFLQKDSSRHLTKALVGLGVEPYLTPLIVCDKGGAHHLRESQEAVDTLCTLPITSPHWRLASPRGQMRVKSEKESSLPCKECLAVAKTLPSSHPVAKEAKKSIHGSAATVKDISDFEKGLTENLSAQLKDHVANSSTFKLHLMDKDASERYSNSALANYGAKKLYELDSAKRFENLLTLSQTCEKSDWGPKMKTLAEIILSIESEAGDPATLPWPSEEKTASMASEIIHDPIFFPALFVSRAWPKAWAEFSRLYPREADDMLLLPF